MFGLVAYRHVSDQLRKKVNDKGYHMVLVWYHSTGGYKLYDVVNRRNSISMDVVFHEIKELRQPVTGYSNKKVVPTVFKNA